jgi:aldose 1-epimerase
MDGSVPDDSMVLEAGGARMEIRPQDGGRMRSLVIGGMEVLITEGYGPIMWGCYPMAPWAGRIRDGRFSFRGRDVQLPLTMPPHAIHGTAFDRPWDVAGPDSLTIDLGPAWPFPGRLTQSFALTDDSLEVRLRLDADAAMPAVLGWHPWFRRRLMTADGMPSEPARLDFRPATMYVRDGDGIATGATTSPTPPPWDDCFTDVAAPPRLTWPGHLSLEITSTCSHWVIYDQLEQAICVEPQTGPPDFTTIRPSAVEAGDTLEATMAWRWQRLS